MDENLSPPITDLADLLIRYKQLFLTGPALRDMLVYMCNSYTNEVNDPITHTLCTFLTTPITINITKTGLAPFKDCNMAIYPFFCMTSEQKAFLLQALSFMQDHNLATLSSRMGGGGMAALNAKCPRDYLDTVDVLTQFTIATRTSNQGGQMSDVIRDNICNIVIQRVCSMVHISRTTLNKVMSNMREELEASKTCFVLPASET